MNTAARFLRYLADKLGGETEVDLQARMLGIVRGAYRFQGTKAGIEEAIRRALPVGRTAEFSWNVRNGDEVLMVRFR